MASTKGNKQTQNLASLLLVKQKMAAKNDDRNNVKLPPAATGAHSDERLTYRQNPPAMNPQEATTTTTEPPKDTTEQPKLTRKTKQIEVELLDKKMEEINQKKEVKTNETLDTWKGFDSLNYGFTSDPGQIRSTPVPPVSQHQVTPVPERRSSPVKPLEKTVTEPPRQETPISRQPETRQAVPKRIDSPIKDRPIRLRSPPKEKELEKPSHSPEQKPVEKQRIPSPEQQQPIRPLQRKPTEEEPEKPMEKQPTPPVPAPRRSKTNSAPSLDQAKTPEQLQSKSQPSHSPVFVSENIIPFSSILSNPQVFQQPPLSPSSIPPYKLLPDIKHYEIYGSRNALKSIQRSMDRYRFHIW